MQRLSRREHSGRRLAAALAVAGLVAGVGAIPQAKADLDASSEWSAAAGADAMAIEYLNTAAPVFAAEPIIYGTPATARSFVDSLDQSNAIAAAPYPGDVMVGMPDNGNGALKVAGLPGAIPTYPFWVTTEHPIRPNAVQDQSGNRLEAHSTLYSSSSDARSGLITGDFLAALQAHAASSVSVNSTTGELSALADSQLDGFRLTDALQIGRSTAHAKVVRAPGAAIVRESSFTLGSIVVNGVQMSYGDGGFKYGDQSSQPPGDPAPLFKALEAAGITIEILPAKTTDTSIESAGMKITQVQQYGTYTQRISFIIGRVNASVVGEAKPVAAALLDVPLDSQTSQSNTSGPSANSSASYGPGATEPTGFGASPVTPSFDSVAPTSASFGYSYPSASGRLPDLSLPAAVGGQAVVPAIVDAISPGAKASEQAAAPEVRLIKPAASVGRSLRDDDYAGVLGAASLVGLGALLAAGLFLVFGKGRGPAVASALKLPGA